MSHRSTPCPACGDHITRNMGKLHRYEGMVDLPFPTYLFKCSRCHLFFRYPYMSESELLNIYTEACIDFWNYGSSRQDYSLASRIVQHTVPSGNILDVGCFRGDFLLKLPEYYYKFGIEPSEPARRIASGSGIKLIGASINSIDSSSPVFDMITFIDVLEHLPNPFKALQTLAGKLKSEGYFLITTGNTTALTWRLMRNDYWYHLTEHVCFFSLQWFRWAADRLGARIVKVVNFSHFKSSIFTRCYQFIQSLTYYLFKKSERIPLLKRVGTHVYPFSRAAHWHSAPETKCWKDHVLIVMKFDKNRLIAKS